MRKTLVLLGSIFSLFLGIFSSALVMAESTQLHYARATFGGGCFWCMEPPYDKLDGVVNTVSGFSGGHVESPTYKQVGRGGTGHIEVVQVTYDPGKISYKELLDVYWVNTDPLDGRGQFCDRGHTYRPIIFAHDEGQKQQAELSKAELVASDRLNGEVITPIVAYKNFYAADEYHQDYYQKNPIRYKWYRGGCGRDKRLRALWGESDH